MPPSPVFTRDGRHCGAPAGRLRCAYSRGIRDADVTGAIRACPGRLSHPALGVQSATAHKARLATDDRWAARAGWDLTAERVAKSPDGLGLPALLDRIESEMANADPVVQWTMNNTLAAIGIHFPKHRKRAIATGEKLEIYRDYPVSKGLHVPIRADVRQVFENVRLAPLSNHLPAFERCS
jgi:hypothetical protein